MIGTIHHVRWGVATHQSMALPICLLCRGVVGRANLPSAPPNDLNRPLHLRRCRHRIPGFSELVSDGFVDVEKDLPVVVGVAIAAHGEQRAFGGELADFYFGCRFFQYVFDAWKCGFQSCHGIVDVDAIGYLRFTIDAPLR